jgi:flavin reductase (DIM6/NTAB) family NADH-FMN oxidoreductase RutF
MKKLILITLSVFLVSRALCQISSDSLSEFKLITYKEFGEEAMKLIADDWMLITAGSLPDTFNMMTASWGGLGWLWNKPVAFIFVRPQRYTYQFTEKEDYFTLTFFEEKYRDTLLLLGTKSGRDFDKMKMSGLTPIETKNKSVAFKEARIILECKKVYATTLRSEDFVDMTIDKKVYKEKDYHKMYIGVIENIWVKEDIKSPPK